MPVEHGPKPRTPQAEQRLQEIKSRLAEAKDLAIRTVGDSRGPTKDRLVVMVRDPYWLHAYWELGRRSVQRRGGNGPALARRPSRAAYSRIEP